jgi:hypothetical protein
VKYDVPIISNDHAAFCLREAARRYGGQIVRDHQRMYCVRDDAGLIHTDAVLRAASIHAIENEDWEQKADALDTIAEKHGLATNWSVEGVDADAMDQPHPYPEATMLECNGEMVPINGKTWLALWIAADVAYRRSDDPDRCFIEEISTCGELLRAQMGS